MNGIRLLGCRRNKASVLNLLTRRLIELGYQRIVLMVKEERRIPKLDRAAEGVSGDFGITWHQNRGL